MSSTASCKKCGSTEIEVDRARGITCCTNCGNVLEESIIVSEVQIEEGAGGGCNVIGQFVSASDTGSSAISINGLQNTLRESKEITLQNGKRLINEMASQLRLNQHCIDTAFNFYKLAVQRGLTRGRKIRQVIAACLYLVCRTEGTPHMLLDLCDIVHDDACYISSLGKLAMKFAYLLCIKLPEIDPGLFIPRFAQKLNFGDKTHEVTYTALRLVQRMNRDWMATGRRPSGLCGAALLVSARLYEFERSLDDIVKVVKIGKTTLRKRMLEFEDTPSSNMTVDEFHTIDLDEEHDPPAFTRSKKLAKIKQIEEMANLQEIEKEIMQLQENIEQSLEELQPKPRGIFAKFAKLTEFEDEILGPNKDLLNVDAEIKDAEDFLSQEQIDIIKSIVTERRDANANSSSSSTSSALAGTSDDGRWNNLRPTLKSLGFVRPSVIVEQDEDEDDDEDLASDDESISDFSDLYDESENVGGGGGNDSDDDLNLESIRKRRLKLKKLRKMKKQRLNDDMREQQQPQQSETTTTATSLKQSSATSIDSTAKATSTIETETNNEKATTVSSDAKAAAASDELDLEDIDDDEINSMILSKDEIKTKAKLWLRANKDWLKEQKIKEELKKKEREEQSQNGKGGGGSGASNTQFDNKQAKKTRVRKQKNTAPVANPHEAIERMLQEKKLSSKINYDVLKNLNMDLKKT